MIDVKDSSRERSLTQEGLDVGQRNATDGSSSTFHGLDGKTKPKDGTWVSDEFSAGQYFLDVYRWVRSLDESLYPGAQTLPLWWAEWYASSPQDWQDLKHFNAVMASDLAYTVRSGASLALIWKPQGDAAGFAHPEGIWTDSSIPGGGQATPFYYTQKAYRSFFSVGTPLYRVASTAPDKLTGIASASKTMLINKTAEVLSVSLNEAPPVTLYAYAVIVVDTQS